MQNGLQQLTGATQVDNNNKVTLLTACPACQQGLSRYADDTGLETKYIVVELAERKFGPDWQKAFIGRIQAGGIEQVLL